MTSRKLFFRLIWQDFKKRIWCPILIFVVYLLSMEVPLLNQFDRMKRYPTDYTYNTKHYLANDFFSPDANVMILYMTGIIAAVCAFGGYAYLHSRKQLDTYHSMPVKRAVLFFARYFSGLLMFVVPFAQHILLCLVIGMTNGAFSWHGIVNAAGFLIIQTLCFLLIYSLCIVAVCLTGNMIISILGSCVLVGYSTILSYLKLMLCNKFLYTYFYSYGEEICAFSPIGMLINLFEDIYEYRELNTGFSYRCIVSYSFVIVAGILVFTAVGAFLYQKRATEAAGRPIAFPITEPFIKSIVVLPVSIMAGFFIKDIAGSSSFGWLVFGISFGFVVSALVMEVIFRLDIKCVFCHWKQLVFNGACLILIIVVFKYDVLGYNSYVPAEQELAGCAVSIHDLMDINVEERSDRYGYQYIDAEEYRFENMNILDNPSVMALANKAASEGLHLKEYDDYEGFQDSPEYEEIAYQEQNYYLISFKYTKKNGKEIYRRYWIDLTDEESLALLADIFNDTDYKLGAFPILSNGWKKEYGSIECRSKDFIDTVKISAERQARLFEVYQNDLMKLTLDDVRSTMPLGNITFYENMNHHQYAYGGSEDGYKIYPQFTETIELLKEYGFDYTEVLSTDRIKKVIVSIYSEELEEAFGGGYTVAMYYRNEIVLEYTDKESIEAIMQNVHNDELVYGLYSYLSPCYDSGEVTVYYDDDGVESSNTYYFLDGEAPNFIEEDYNKKLEEVIAELSLQN